MSQPLLSRVSVVDLVPFGNAGTTSECYALRLSPPAWENWQPGQFVMLRPLEGACGPLWGRPFSICQMTNRDLVLFFQVRGRATLAMSRFRPGDEVDIWGPLGNALAMEPGTPTLLLAGGIGIAPFVGYAHRHPTPWTLTMEFGHRLPLNFYPFDSLNEKILADAHLDAGPDDLAAFIATMEKRVAEHAAQNGLVLACGPTPFLRTVQEMLRRHGARGQLCLETRMACGIGACLGCVVRATLDGAEPSAASSGDFVQTCTCGPNFWAHSVTV